MGYPSSLGFVWHITDKIAIRPEFSVAQASTETTTSVDAGRQRVDDV